MDFLSEVNSLKSKLHLGGKTVPLCVAAIVVVVLLCVVFGVLWNAFAVGEVEVVSADETEQSDDADGGTDTDETWYVHVTGAVANPGMYELPANSRVNDAIAAAGGFTEDANQSSINLARVLSDGEQLAVASTNDDSAQATTSASGASSSSASAASSSSTGLVNINTATASELTALPGIGDATAAKIVADREANGSFKTKEDLKRVSGIGDKKYAALEDLITV